MAVRDQDIVRVWDGDSLIEQNIKFLRTPTNQVEFPISGHINKIVADLVDTFQAVPCAGIAANQIGYDKKIFIGMKHDREVDDDGKHIDEVEPDPDNYELYINPQIDKTDSKSTQIGSEGCLSIPNITLEIERYDKIKVRYYDASGRKIKKPLSGFLSRLYQHELDHLNGNLMFENPLSNIYISEYADKKYVEQLQSLVAYLK